MSKEISIARVYTLEGHNHLNQLLTILRDEEQVLGATVMRGIAGFGVSKDIHTSSLLNLSLELPLIIEFYDETEKVIKTIEKLKCRLALNHIISWPVTVHIEHK